MPISFGSSGFGEIYYGSTPIKEVYSGSQLVWSASSWPRTGSWSGNTNQTTVLATFTAPETGSYSVGWSITWGGTANLWGSSARYRVDGGGWVSGNAVWESPRTSTVHNGSLSLNQGDVIEFAVEMATVGSFPATASWSVELLPPTSWPQTGTWSGNTTATSTTVASFTVTEAGVYDFEWAVTWGGSSAVAGRASYRINTGSGVQGNLVNTAPGTSTVTGSSVTLAVGDVVEFRVISIGTVAATGAWTVTKN